jgi:hypothetical protein
MKSIHHSLLLIFLLSLPAIGCKKQLDTKPNSKVLVPTTPTELQGLLDNPEVFSYGLTLGLLSADEFNFSATYYSALPKTMQNVYTWQDYPFDSTETPHDYARIYQQVNYTNVVLEGVSKLIEKTGRDKGLDRIKGDALFKRALAFYHCLQIFAPAYDNQTATTDLGIPLILKSAEDRTITRPSVQECYDQILSCNCCPIRRIVTGHQEWQL